MLLLLFGAASGQQEPSFRSQSNLVPVPILVRDAAGNAVYGLRAQDFIIEDDGVEQAVHLDETADAETAHPGALRAGAGADQPHRRIQDVQGHPRRIGPAWLARQLLSLAFPCRSR